LSNGESVLGDDGGGAEGAGTGTKGSSALAGTGCFGGGGVPGFSVPPPDPNTKMSNPAVIARNANREAALPYLFIMNPSIFRDAPVFRIP
jgi:hypothetical protein